MTAGDTVFALSSGSGRSGVAVIRASGSAARSALARMVRVIPESRRASVRYIRHAATDVVIDRGVVLWLPGPESVTGEDVFELHVHGSPAILAAVYDSLGSIQGLRLAEPGEFTRRAFQNGRMDLVEAEGLADLLQSRTETQRRQALFHYLGDASSIYECWRRDLIRVLAHIEASVDFVDEEGVADAALRDVRDDVLRLSSAMAAALERAEAAVSLRNGVRVVLAGLPNTGKSSLLNALAQREAAIVSPIAGTTRDVIEVQLDLGGVPVVLTDTAGLRSGSDDPIERMGIERSEQQLRSADVVVWVMAPDVADSGEMPAGVRPDLVLLNKSDLLRSGQAVEELAMPVSALSQDSVGAVVARLGELVFERYGHVDDAVVVRARHRTAIIDSIRYLNDSLRHHPFQIEFVAEDLRKAAHAMARITGRIGVEDLLDSIFAEFCVGK